MEKLLGGRNEAKEALSGKEFVPVGIDRLPDGTAIIRGTADGQDMAIVWGADQMPLELLTGDDNPNREGGPLTALKNHPATRSIGGVATAALGGLALAACQSSPIGQHYDHNGPTYGIHSSALTEAQMGSVSGQVAPWSKFFDSPSNFAEMNGEHYILINSYGGPDAGSITYIECAKLAACLDASAQRQHVEGLDTNVLGNPPYTGALIYQNKDGKFKLTFGTAQQGSFEGDIGKNPATGKLAITNLQVPNIGFSAPSLVYENGVPHALDGDFDTNLFDGTTKQWPFPDWYLCGAPTLDGDLAIAPHLETIQGQQWCQLVMAKSLDELATKAAQITTLNSKAPSKDLENPRLATAEDGSGILIYSVMEPGVTDSEDTRIWYALIPAPATSTSADTDTIDSGTTEVDSGTSPDTPDAIIAPETVVADATKEVAQVVDALEIEAETAVTEAEIAQPDIAQGVDTPDTQADIPPELPPQDTAATETIDYSNLIKLTTSDCNLTITPKDIGDQHGVDAEITGDGSQICAADITVNGKPATLTLSNTSNGQIQITCELFPNQSPLCNPGFDTTAEVKEQGAGTKLVTPQGITLGSSASNFLMTPRIDGSFEVANFDSPTDPQVILTFLDKSTIAVPSDGQIYVVAKDGKALALKNPPAADTGSDDTGQPENDAASTDASNSLEAAPDTNGSLDTGAINAPTQTPKNGGCSSTPLSQTDPEAFGTILAGATLALLEYRRRRRSVQ